jgi:hypothetical protein
MYPLDNKKVIKYHLLDWLFRPIPVIHLDKEGRLIVDGEWEIVDILGTKVLRLETNGVTIIKDYEEKRVI